MHDFDAAMRYFREECLAISATISLVFPSIGVKSEWGRCLEMVVSALDLYNASCVPKAFTPFGQAFAGK